MHNQDLAPISRWKNALSRLRQWIQSDAAPDAVRVTDAEPHTVAASPSQAFRETVQEHRAHPLEAHPAPRTDEPEAITSHSDDDSGGSEQRRAARDPMGSGMAQRMLSSALGGDPESWDDEDRELGMHIIDEPESEVEEDFTIELLQTERSRPITRH